MWSQLGEVAGTFGPWCALVGFALFLGWTVLLVREFTRGHLARSGRPFTVKLWGLSIHVGSVTTSEPPPAPDPKINNTMPPAKRTDLGPTAASPRFTPHEHEPPTHHV
jgi:hypothetical protein